MMAEELTVSSMLRLLLISSWLLARFYTVLLPLAANRLGEAELSSWALVNDQWSEPLVIYLVILCVMVDSLGLYCLALRTPAYTIYLQIGTYFDNIFLYTKCIVYMLFIVKVFCMQQPADTICMLNTTGSK